MENSCSSSPITRAKSLRLCTQVSSAFGVGCLALGRTSTLESNRIRGVGCLALRRKSTMESRGLKIRGSGGDAASLTPSCLATCTIVLRLGCIASSRGVDIHIACSSSRVRNNNNNADDEFKFKFEFEFEFEQQQQQQRGTGIISNSSGDAASTGRW